jgi:hypothetical protein
MGAELRALRRGALRQAQDRPSGEKLLASLPKGIAPEGAPTVDPKRFAGREESIAAEAAPTVDTMRLVCREESIAPEGCSHSGAEAGSLCEGVQASNEAVTREPPSKPAARIGNLWEGVQSRCSWRHSRKASRLNPLPQWIRSDVLAGRRASRLKACPEPAEGRFHRKSDVIRCPRGEHRGWGRSHDGFEATLACVRARADPGHAPGPTGVWPATAER